MTDALLNPKNVAYNDAYDPRDTELSIEELLDLKRTGHDPLNDDDSQESPFDHNQLDAVIDKLPPVEQQAVSMHMLGWSQQRIGRALGMTQRAARYRLHRAQQRIKWWLDMPPRPPYEQYVAQLSVVVKARRHTCHVNAVLMAVETTCTLTAAKHFGIDDALVWFWVNKAKAIPGPTGVYVRYRVGTHMTYEVPCQASRK